MRSFEIKKVHRLQGSEILVDVDVTYGYLWWKRTERRQFIGSCTVYYDAYAGVMARGDLAYALKREWVKLKSLESMSFFFLDNRR